MTTEEALRVKDELVDEGSAAMQREMERVPPPAKLYHFTDCSGLIGVMTSRCLWASLATSLNDGSEVLFGIKLAKQLMSGGTLSGFDGSFLAEVAQQLDQPAKTFTNKPIEFETYIISLCEGVDQSAHWLHYGRLGLGCAIGLETAVLATPPFMLARVLYVRSEQETFISRVLESAWTVVKKYGLHLRDSTAKQLLYQVAVEMAANRIRMLAPLLKSPAFANEGEWRLFTYDVRVDGKEPEGGVRLDRRFREMNGRVIPYFELKLAAIPITDLVLGWSFPMQQTDAAIGVLLRDAAPGREVAVSRSTIPVRP